MDAMIIATTIWLALGAYAVAELRKATGGAEPGVRRVWTAGAILYLCHVAAAFGLQHEWSHQSAYAYTASQTAALTGLDWGGGLYVNYAFTAVWTGETAWWWMSPTTYRLRSLTFVVASRVLFVFMIANGAVLFVEGPRRWLGVAVVAAVGVAWLIGPAGGDTNLKPSRISRTARRPSPD